MLWDAGRTSSVVDKAKHTAQQAYFRLDQAKEDLMVEALNAWINLGKAYNNWQSNMKVQKNAMTTLKMTTEKVKKGEASKMEQLQIEQQFRTYQTLTMTSKLAYDSAVERFRTVWKFTPKNIDQMPMPVSDLLGMIPEAGTNVKNNTTIKIASMDVKIAEQQLRFDNADFKPRVDGKLSYTEKEGELGGGFDNEQKEEWRADITMTWQVFGGFKKTHVYRADKSRLKAAEIRLTDTVNATQEQFNNSWNNYVLVEKNLKTLKRTVEINQEMYNLTLADFKAGNTPIMAVFGMKTSLIMSEVAYQNAQLDLTIARYQLHKLLGIVNPLFKQ
jgi:outer membrane protein TolC